MSKEYRYNGTYNVILENRKLTRGMHYDTENDIINITMAYHGITMHSPEIFIS